MQDAFPVRGNIPAVVTPCGEDGSIQEEDFERIVHWHLEHGVHGICVAGDNGESWSLSAEERRRLTAIAVRATGGRVPVVVGASSTTARQSIAYAEAAAEAGATALMIGPQPYVMKTTSAELVRRFEAIHKAVPLPILLYDSPRRTGIALTIETMLQITEAVPVVALKEASRDFFYLTHVIRTFSERLAVLVGPAPFIIPGMQLGAAGFISSGPELFGARTALAMEAGSMVPSEALRDLHFGFTRIYETLMALGTWPSALKAAHACSALPAGVPREPVQRLDDAASIHSPGDVGSRHPGSQGTGRSMKKAGRSTSRAHRSLGRRTG
jgi:4-hydroxy-tetrahydrodipicolinate synthase